VVVSNVPNPAQILPAEGVTEVLVRAAAAHPGFTLVLVLVFLLFTVACVCWLLDRRNYYDLLASPQAGEALVAIKKVDNAHKKAMTKMKNEAKQQKKQSKQKLPSPVVTGSEAG